MGQAREAVEAGADIIVAQGMEAGGHGMAEPLFTLLPQVVDACPGSVVVAAGGIERQMRWPAQYTGRLLRNRHVEAWLGREGELESRMDEIGREYIAARERGDFDIAGVIAGEASALIHDIPRAAEIVQRIVDEAERLLRRAADLER